MNIKPYALLTAFCVSLLFGGCAINLGPPTVDLKESPRPPIFRLGKINEQHTGSWPSGGLRIYLANALHEPAAASLFTKDGSGLAMQIDITSDHEDDGPRLIGLGALSLVTLGIIPLHYHSAWPVQCAVTVRSEDGAVHGRYTFETKGEYDIWTYPPTMFTLLGAGLHGNADAKEVLQRTSRDIVFQIMAAVESDYVRLAAVYRSQVKVQAKAQAEEQTVEASSSEELPVIRSDVDDVPAVTTKPNAKAYAVVIGVERHRQKLPRADFATHDAQTVADYLTRALGYPEENVITLLNDKALKSDFEKYFEKWLPNNVEPGSTVFIYYSGHGAPNPRTGDAYLVPYDGDPSFIAETGYSVKRLYDALGKLPAKKVIVALDSCFSGAGGRSVIAKGSRPLIMNLQNNVVLPKHMTVLSASAGDQTSSTYDEKGHGLFTYFLLKGIKNEDVLSKDGSIKVDDLYGYLKPMVERVARKQYNNEQTPQLME